MKHLTKFKDFVKNNITKKRAVSTLKTAVASYVTLPFYTLVHEYFHYFAAKIMDPSSEILKINFNSLYGGALFEKFSDKIHSVNMGLLKGAEIWAKITKEFNALEDIIFYSAPYILTPAGMYLMYDGIKNKKPFRFGVGLVPALSLIYHSFKNSEGEDFYYIREALNKSINNSSLTYFLTLIGVCLSYVGSYYLAKKLVNWKDKLFSKKKEIKNLEEKVKK